MESNVQEQYQLYDDYEEIDLRELILDIWNNKFLILGITFIFIFAAGIYSFLIADPVYEANTTIQLSNLEGFYSNPDTAMRLLTSNALVMPVMDELEQDYNEAELQRYLENNVTIKNTADTGIIDISLKNTDPLLAEKVLRGIILDYQENADLEYNEITNNMKENIISIDNNLVKLETQIKVVNQDINNISGSDLLSTEKSILIAGLTNELSIYIEQEHNFLAEKRLIEGELLSYQPFRILNQPYVSETPVSPRKMLNLAIAAFLGLFLGIFIVFAKKFFTEEDFSESASQ